MRPPYMPLLPISTDLSNLPIKLALYALIGVLLLVTYGIVGSLYIMHLNPLNSLYFTVKNSNGWFW
jgi:voltage-gated potassium channel